MTLSLCNLSFFQRERERGKIMLSSNVSDKKKVYRINYISPCADIFSAQNQLQKDIFIFFSFFIFLFHSRDNFNCVFVQAQTKRNITILQQNFLQCNNRTIK